MIAALRFDPASFEDGPRVREASFVSRSTLPLSAACLVANGVREALSRLLAREFEVELIEPAIPDAGERRVLLDDATVLRVRGRICDGFIVVRAGDARRLVACAFGEAERSDRAPLSDIERTTLDRIVMGLIPLCNTLCGTLGPIGRDTADRAAGDITTYFEVRTSGVPRIAVGFALSKDPDEDVADRLTLDDLSDVEVSCEVIVGTGSLAVPAFTRLAPGATLALDTSLGGHGLLRVGHIAFARGTCGVRNGRCAIDIIGVAGGAARVTA